jgi:AraC-like DNA-binding protein
MLHLDYTIDIHTGGSYSGNFSWNKKKSDIDNCFKIYHITSGNLFICDSLNEYQLQAGSFYFINGNKLSSQHCNESFSTNWLHFSPKKIIIQQQLRSMPLITPLKMEANVDHSIFNEIGMLLNHQKEVSYTSYCFKTLALQHFVQSAILEILMQSNMEQTYKDFNTNNIDPAIQYIDEHYTEQIKLDYLASICCMSVSYFHRTFTQILHTTPINYITRLRMNAVLPLLQNETSIKEIAYLLGYCNDAYFSRVFKSYYGIPPGDYKKNGGQLLF